MISCSRVVYVSAFLLVGAIASYTRNTGAAEYLTVPQTFAAVQAEPSWEGRLLNLPVLHSLARFFDLLPLTPEDQPDNPTPATPDAQPELLPTVASPVGSAPIPTAPVNGGCPVAPLEPITDPAALALEANGGADVAHMVPGAERALVRFESKVTSVGGTIELKSAYRPASYQRHLQNVWYTWMALRNNNLPACQALKAHVRDEFARHHLIETQHPVSVSDHTRGTAFDATVDLPKNARLGRRRVTLDALARLAGLMRPAILADPVHFKWFGLRRRGRIG